MKLLVNSLKQGQCPSCGQWCDLLLDEKSPYHIFSCCDRYFRVALNEKDLEKISKGKKVKPPPVDWWVYK